jgi:hypothetical protein
MPDLLLHYHKFVACKLPICPLFNSTHSFALKKGAFTTDIPVTDELDAPAVVPVPKENEKGKCRLSTMPEPKGKVDD